MQSVLDVLPRIHPQTTILAWHILSEGRWKLDASWKVSGSKNLNGRFQSNGSLLFMSQLTDSKKKCTCMKGQDEERRSNERVGDGPSLSLSSVDEG